MDLSVIIPALNEERNLAILIPRLRHDMPSDLEYEIIVVDGHSSDRTREVAKDNGARVIVQNGRGYGAALRDGFRLAKGRYLLTLDADLSHDPSLIKSLWNARDSAEIIIASRYAPGGGSDASRFRKLLSLVLNEFLARGLSLPVKDCSSGFRLYTSSAVRDMTLEGSDFDVLVEILVRAFAQGWKIAEVPLHYAPREFGKSHMKLFGFGMSFLRTFGHMWTLRNSIECADYDQRAYDSVIPFQRWWQRRRHRVVTDFAAIDGLVLDIGCGSSVILKSLGNAVGVDILLHKLRYVRDYGKSLVNASVFELPFADESFDCVICSQVIEHLSPGSRPIEEMLRVLRENGRLVLGTPDYGRLSWRIIEKLYKLLIPTGYADEHITHYTQRDLVSLLERYDFRLQQVRYIFSSEMVALFEREP